jgi:hypothetical protein
VASRAGMCRDLDTKEPWTTFHTNEFLLAR